MARWRWVLLTIFAVFSSVPTANASDTVISESAPKTPENERKGSPTPEPEGSPDRQLARELGYSGLRAYGARDFVRASAQLERSYELLPVPSLGLWSARALVALGKLVEAEARYRAVGGLDVGPNAADVHRAAKATAELELAELLPRLPSVSLALEGAPPSGVVVTLDDVVWPEPKWAERRLVNPGAHRISGLAGSQRVEVDFIATEGNPSDVILRFTPATALTAPGAEAGHAATIGWILVAAGGASLAASGVTYAVGKSRYDELTAGDACRGERCPPSAQLDSYQRLRTAQILTLAIGAVLGASGATLLVLDADPVDIAPVQSAAARESGLRFLLGPSSVALVGEY